MQRNLLRIICQEEATQAFHDVFMCLLPEVQSSACVHNLFKCLYHSRQDLFFQGSCLLLLCVAQVIRCLTVYPNFAIANLRVRMHPLLARTSANLKHRGLGVFSTVLVILASLE
uniref:Uncharacterized protein n=1 Tax=Opuntia streptacantha TaxID=393608 RepID=A0A7C9DR93_OPUST